MKRCQFYKPIEQNAAEKCPNCKRWDGKRCKDEQQIREAYLDSEEYKYFDRMMRGNRGISGPL
ncbi:hypothetical protein [Desulfosporosinus acididurans]|uniref:hypothetical protein n=1 Tax=Desulfosporosinus acididurans TaxID=476652 RepID=UPI00064B205C|nr:hypothetical protein [Desulfosporosinus acididurans]